jgi:CDP-4-dehydro-6-deoxyglucose reductase, E3
MALLTFGETPIDIAPGEDVLSALLAAGIDAPHSCRAGVCQTCLHQLVEGDVPAAAQQGLSDGQKTQGYFMACVCVPHGPLKIVRVGEALGETEAIVHAIDQLSPTVVRLRLEPKAAFSYRSGQFLSLKASDGLVRNYSIASHPEEHAFLELHVRLLPNGRMSSMISERLALGDSLAVSGPFGTCFYDDADRDRPLVLIGVGTGLAPLWGVLHDALKRGHNGPIRLYHGARNRSGLYLVDELRDLAEQHAHFSYVPCVPGEIGPGGGDLEAAVIEGEPQPDLSAYFLCGGAGVVGRVKRGLYLRGAKLQRLRTDIFLPAS